MPRGGMNGGLVDTGLTDSVLQFGQMGQQNAQFAANLALRARLEEMQLAQQARSHALEQQRFDLQQQQVNQANQRYSDQRGAMTAYARGMGGLPEGMTPEQAANLPEAQFNQVTGPGDRQFQFNAASAALDRVPAGPDQQPQMQGAPQFGADGGSRFGPWAPQAGQPGGGFGPAQPEQDAFDRKMQGVMSDSRLAASPINKKAAKNQLVWTYLLGLPGAAKPEFDPDTQVALRNQLGADSPEWQMYQEHTRAIGEPNAVLAHQLLDSQVQRKMQSQDFGARVSSVQDWPDSPIKKQALSAIAGGYATPTIMSKLASDNEEIVKKAEEAKATAAVKGKVKLDPDEGARLLTSMHDTKALPMARNSAYIKLRDAGYPVQPPPTWDPSKDPQTTLRINIMEKQLSTLRTQAAEETDSTKKAQYLQDMADVQDQMNSLINFESPAAKRAKQPKPKERGFLERVFGAVDSIGSAIGGPENGPAPATGSPSAPPAGANNSPPSAPPKSTAPASPDRVLKLDDTRKRALLSRALDALGQDARDEDVVAWMKEHANDGE